MSGAVDAENANSAEDEQICRYPTARNFLERGTQEVLGFFRGMSHVPQRITHGIKSLRHRAAIEVLDHGQKKFLEQNYLRAQILHRSKPNEAHAKAITDGE